MKEMLKLKKQFPEIRWKLPSKVEVVATMEISMLEVMVTMEVEVMINTEVAMVDMEAVNSGVDLEAMVIIEAMEVEVTSTEAVDTDMDTDMDTDITAGETSMETVAMAAVATVAMAAVAVGMVVIMV